MPKTEDELDRLWNEANDEVKARSFHVYPSSISIEATAAYWPTEQGIGPFLDLALALGCRIVYMRSRRLSADELIDTIAVGLSRAIDALDASSPEDFLAQAGVADHPDSIEYLHYGRRQIGRRMDITIEWVHGSVVHRFQGYAKWHGQLMEKAEKVTDLIEARLETE